MPNTNKADGFVVIGLLLLSTMPLVTGALRLTELSN